MDSYMDAYPSFYQLAADRHSCRKYLPQTPEKSVIMAVLDAARLAPSACNKQPWTFVVVCRDTDPELHAAVAASYGRDWATEAPVLIVACGDRSVSWKRPEDGWDSLDVDMAIATEHLCLAATALGLGTCWICNFKPEAMREALNCPEDIVPVAMTPLGYPDPEAAWSNRPRKELDEIVRWGSF